MVKEKILVVEDEEDILELIIYNLSQEGYRAKGVTSGEEALRILRKETFDLVILDLMLPGVDGKDVCKTIKQDSGMCNTPVIMVTARGEESDVVIGLELGADDYITKPFSNKIMVARVRAVIRRSAASFTEKETSLEFGNLSIHPGHHEVRIKNKVIPLTLTEYRILTFLAKRPGWVFSRYDIIDAVQGEDRVVTDRTVDVQIVGLRKKLGADGKRIETVRGVGYKFRESL